jgi:type VI secretion system protein ImpG
MDGDLLLDYYNRELAYLRELGAEFARAHPQVAGRLLLEAERCEDPHVERLLEGFALLAARLRRKLDDEYPEITEAFLSVVFPHYLRPIPSLTIVQFEPAVDPTKMLEGHIIPPNARMVSAPIDGVRCAFRTAYPIELWPVTVRNVTLAPDQVIVEGKPSEAEAMLSIELGCGAPQGWPTLKGLQRLRFYIDAPEPTASTVHEHLFAHLCGVWARGRTADQRVRTLTLPLSAVQPVGYHVDEGLWPYPPHAFPGYRLLQEFFTLPEKFLFFDVGELQRLAAADLVGPVELLFFFRRSPRSAIKVRADTFKLGCAPAANLFELSTEPIRLDRFQSEYPVIPKYDARASYEVVSINKVVSAGGFLEESIEYRPFYGLRYDPGRQATEAYWYATRQPSPVDESVTELRLAFTDLHFRPTVPGVEAVTVHATCSNRDLPSRLPFGGGQNTFILETEAAVSRVLYLTRPRPSYRPPMGRSTQWRVISSLALNHLSLVGLDDGSPDALRELLSVYDFVDTDATRKMIRGLVGVSSRRIAGRVGNRLGKALSLGLEITLQFDEMLYPGARSFLLASVLERFLASYVSLNAFTQTVATSKQREGRWKAWPPRSGDRTLL